MTEFTGNCPLFLLCKQSFSKFKKPPLHKLPYIPFTSFLSTLKIKNEIRLLTNRAFSLMDFKDLVLREKGKMPTYCLHKSIF